jgi:hypothetical protein
MPSFDASAAGSGGGGAASASFSSSLDIGGRVDEEGVYHETDAERQRREALARQLEQAKKKRKKKAFV